MDPDVLRQQGEDLYNAERYEEAERVFRMCLAAAPHDAAAHYNLGVVLARQDRYREAIGCFATALKHNPSLSLAYTNTGFCLNELGEIHMAERAFSIACQLAPDDPMPQLNEGLARLTLGKFREGWPQFEARWQRPETKLLQRNFEQPLWRGEAIEGKSILLHAEEGFGDSIQMARYVPLLQKRGARLIVEVQPALMRLFRRSLPHDVVVITEGDPLPAFDFHVPMLSIPLGFDTELETIPRDTPYLRAPEDDKDRWSKQLEPYRTKRVGLVWAGRPSHERDRHRSLTLTQLAPLFALSHIAWVNLQYPLTPQDQSFFSAHNGFIENPVLFKDFAETAGLIDNLDLVLTVDTAVAHLSGALGKPTWVLLPYVADWRWLLEREDSPWYPTMRLYRQPQARDWGSVILQIIRDLQPS